MEVNFEKMGIKFYLPSGTMIYKKDELLKKLNYTYQQKKDCLLVLGRENTDWILLVNYLTDGNKIDYNEIIDEYIDANNKAKLKLTERDKLISEDGRSIDYLIFYDGINFTIVVITLVNNKIIYSITHCSTENKKESLDFSLSIMKSLFKI